MCSVATLLGVDEYLINPVHLVVIFVINFEVDIWHMNLWEKDSVHTR